MNILKFTKVNILSNIYSIQYCEDGFQVDEDKRQFCLGQISCDNKSIRVKIRDKEAMFKTLLHEISHGIIDEFGIRSLLESNDRGELIAELLSAGFTDTLIRNKLVLLD